MKIHSMAPRRRHERTDTGNVCVFVQPPPAIGGPEVSVLLTPEQFERYAQWRECKGMIQDLLPELSDSEREMLMTGLTDEAFNQIARGEE